MDKEKIYQKSPHLLQNLMISVFNIIAYKKRYGGKYKFYRKQYKKNQKLSFHELKQIQNKKLENFLSYTYEKSRFYKRIYKKQPTLQNFSSLPILTKEALRKDIKNIFTVEKSKALVSKTGGTTGKSLEVLFTHEDTQDRFAMLDDFRSRFGYKLGKKTAWFSGKKILSNKDLKRKRFWKHDYFYNVRYYSTFHIKDDFLKYYIEDLMKFQPEYIIGFPSSIKELAEYGLRNNIEFPYSIKAVFPTAETITNEMYEKIELFFKTEIFNQYASSEGAPFIFECEKRNLHLELQSGVFEVLDDNNEPANKGKLVVTSFTTHGTPLIRYDIGDSISLSDKTCTCGNNNPLVDEILGRTDDYLYSVENGKVNLGNISNNLKNVRGVIEFQVIQNTLDSVLIKVVTDDNIYTSKDEKIFINNWRDRMGYKMMLKFEYVDFIGKEKSGKFRIIKNNIKHLI